MFLESNVCKRRIIPINSHETLIPLPHSIKYIHGIKLSFIKGNIHKSAIAMVRNFLKVGPFPILEKTQKVVTIE